MAKGIYIGPVIYSHLILSAMLTRFIHTAAPTPVCCRLSILLLYALLGFPWAVFSQTLAFDFLETVKCPKNTRTAALLEAGEDGYKILRLQQPNPDEQGSAQAEIPWMVTLSADGSLVSSKALPGFGAADQFSLRWKWSIAAGAAMLVIYEKRDAKPKHRLFVRRYHLQKGDWDGPEAELFEAAGGLLTGDGYRVAPNGEYTCVYAFSADPNGPTRMWAAVFDRTLTPLWQKNISWAPKNNLAIPQQVFCTNEGELAVHAHAFLQSSKGGLQAQPVRSPAWWPDGKAVLPETWGSANDRAHSHAICLFGQETAEPDWYYPAIGKDFTSAVVLSQDTGNQLYCAGFAGEQPQTAERYFIYNIDLKTKAGKMLQNAPLSPGLRKAFLSEKAAADKAPIEGLNLLQMEWTADGAAWLLAEQTLENGESHLLKDAVLMRLDSVWKMVGVRKMEKSSRHTNGATQFFGAIAPIRAPKGGWYLCGNSGNWPQTKVVLAECKRSGQAIVYDIADCHEEGATLLPHTLYVGDGKWYFVAESEYREMFRIAELGPDKAKRKR